MQTFLIEIDSDSKAKELSSVLSLMDFVRKVSTIRKPKALIAALQDHENIKAGIVKKKTKTVTRYL